MAWLATAPYVTLLAQCIMGRSHGTPPLKVEQADRQTRVKTLLSRTLRMRAVKIVHTFLDESVNS